MLLLFLLKRKWSPVQTVSLLDSVLLMKRELREEAVLSHGDQVIPEYSQPLVLLFITQTREEKKTQTHTHRDTGLVRTQQL